MPCLSAVAIQPLRMGTPHKDQNKQPSALTPIEEVLKPTTQVSELAHVTSGVNTTSPIVSHETNLENDLQQHVRGKSNGSTDVRWWLSLTLQKINNVQARDDLRVARIIVRRCTDRINQDRGNPPKALSFQNLLLETSMMPHFRGSFIDCGEEPDEWLEGQQRCCLRLMLFKGEFGVEVSVHFSIWHSSGKFPEHLFESRLYRREFYPRTELDKAYFVVVGRHNWETSETFLTTDVYGKMKMPTTESLQHIIQERPSVVFLRNASGDLALSVSKICLMH
jgi:hypothetical protein